MTCTCCAIPSAGPRCRCWPIMCRAARGWRWRAGLYLAALCLREGGPFASAAVAFGGDDRLVIDYMESEFLSRVSARQRTFLTRTAVLERMCGPLCEAVLDVPGSRATLADLAG